MKLTKFEHSCLILEHTGDTLVIDPGTFSRPVTELRGVVAIVISHEHQDHWSPEQVGAILAHNPDARIYGPAGVAAAAHQFSITTVAAGDRISCGAFTLRFFGNVHAEIHSSIPLIDNVAVLVNESLYYAGDSFTVPDDVSVDVLAVPIGAPWLKISEAIDYVDALQPNHTFAVHEMVLSDAGQSLANARIAAATEQGGGAFHPLRPGDSLEI